MVNGIEQGLFVVRPRSMPEGQPAGLEVTIAGPGNAAAERLGLVVRRDGREPRSWPLPETRAIEMPPAGAELLSVRASQGECSIGAVATCELGNLAPGSQACDCHRQGRWQRE